MTKRFVKIGEAAELLGVSIETMRRWEKSGELVPDRKTADKIYDKLEKKLDNKE